MGAKQAGLIVGLVVAVGGGGVLAYQLAGKASEPEPVQEPVARPAEPAPAPALVERDDWDRGGERSEWGPGGFDWSRFDTDGDGELSDEERRAMREQLRAEWEARMDKDGDGEISERERRLARREAMMSNPRGREFAMRFDADGDGELSEEEWDAMREWGRERERERLARMVERFDLDGDGELSEDEEFVADEARRAQFERMREEMTAQFDADGDGQLSRDERATARDQMRSAYERRRFRDQYDSGGDGTVDNGDLESFLRKYNDGEMVADVNGDGVLDSSDVERFRDLMLEHELYGDDLPELPDFWGGRGGWGGGWGGRRGGGGPGGP